MDIETILKSPEGKSLEFKRELSSHEGLESGTYIRVGSTNRLADSIFIRELQRIVKSEAFDEEPMFSLNSEAIDFRVVSEWFQSFFQSIVRLSQLILKP
jgi:predicted HTH transcriptional regulator